MKIGVDLDGVISRRSFPNPSLKLPWWLFIPLVPFTFLISPNTETSKELRRMQREGHEILIISARPKQISKITKRWLKRRKIPYNKLFCVGFGKGTKQRKLDVIQKENIEMYIDHDNKTIEFLRQHSINAIRVPQV